MNKQIRIIVAGGRDFADYQLLHDTLIKYISDNNLTKDQIQFVSGHAKGADSLGETFVKTHCYRLRTFPANWSLYGRVAGPIRNEEMAKYASKANGVLFAFWDGKSRGTKNMIENAEDYGLEVHIVNYQ